MLLKRVVRPCLTAVLAVGVPLFAQVAAASDAQGKCATPTVLQPPASTRRAPVDPSTLDSGRRRPPVAAAPLSLHAPPEAPAATSASPSSTLPPVPPTTAQSTPPPPSAPPPAVPGLSSPTATKGKQDSRPRVAAIQAQGEVPEERLLDVGVEIFGPGVDENDRVKMAKVGLSPEIRKSEARFIAYHLRKTLEGTGNWGAVRVVPQAAAGLDVNLSGRILESNGKRLSLEVEAHDALGRRWLRKRYLGEADVTAYSAAEGTRAEAFQEVYNRIANDLLRGRDDHGAEDLVTVRRVAVLRFAKELAPEAFGPYLKSDDDGRYTLVRFPAEGDPMVGRVASIRERDMMFVDTLNDYYLGFYDRMRGPYAEWKKYSYDEQDSLDRITRESRLKKILGGAAVLMGMLMPRNSQGSDMAGEIAVLGGMIAVQAGFQQAAQKGIHETALKELATSFDADTTPLLVEVEGQQRQLSGSAEAQFVAWRDLLRQILAIETGAPDDPNRVVVSAPPPSL